MPRVAEAGTARCRRPLARATIVPALVLALTSPATAQSDPIDTAQPQVRPRGPKSVSAEVGGWPKISFDTVVAFDLVGFAADRGRNRNFGPSLRFDSTLLVDVNSSLQIDGLFQFKPRKPLPATDPNQNLFINQGAGRRAGGKMKELYVRYGDYRVGKFVQNFGRAYALLPGPFSADLVEESEEGYEPADMIGLEKLHVYGDESRGWRQISFSAFFVDRTFLHESFPYNEGRIHLRDGGVGNTRYPENFMVTFDTINQPVGNLGHLSWQASVIRYGKSRDAERGEWWTSLGGDLSIPLKDSIGDTLSGDYSQLRFYVEAARRDNFNGIAGRSRTYASGSAEYLTGGLIFDVTTTHRWTRGSGPRQTDHLYTATAAKVFPSASTIALSIARESAAGRRGTYAGMRLTQALTVCSRCLARGTFY